MERYFILGPICFVVTFGSVEILFSGLQFHFHRLFRFKCQMSNWSSHDFYACFDVSCKTEVGLLGLGKVRSNEIRSSRVGPDYVG